MKPFAQSADNNKDAILAVLASAFVDVREVLEIGSGTGQHAVYFGRALPDLVWRTSDLEQHHEGITAWVDEAGLDNVRSPVTLNVNDAHWPIEAVDAVYCANTLHIMSWASVESLFKGVGRILVSGGLLAVYGPFNYAGRYTTDSNARFDRSLRTRDPLSGIRDFEKLDELARAEGMQLLSDDTMPANNRLLIWKRQ